MAEAARRRDREREGHTHIHPTDTTHHTANQLISLPLSLIPLSQQYLVSLWLSMGVMVPVSYNGNRDYLINVCYGMN